MKVCLIQKDFKQLEEVQTKGRKKKSDGDSQARYMPLQCNSKRGTAKSVQSYQAGKGKRKTS